MQASESLTWTQRRVLAVLRGRAATHADLRRRLGVGRERLDYALQTLVRTRWLTLDHRRRWTLVRPPADDPTDLEPVLSAAERRELQRQQAQARFREVLALLEAGGGWAEVAARYTLQRDSAHELIRKARRWAGLAPPRQPKVHRNSYVAARLAA